MRSMIVNVLAGIAGNASFYFVDRATIALGGKFWWLAMAAVFIICFTAAAVLQGRRRARVLSGNTARRDQNMEVGKVTIGPAGAGTDVLSGNRAGGKQDIKGGEIQV